MEKVRNILELTIYSKGGLTYYCDYYFYNGISFEKGTTKAGGYGYDKHSTATSNAINKFKMLYNIKQGTKWESLEHATTKAGKKIYGLYNDKTISYGIGLSSVLNCLQAFSNVKIKNIHYGKNEDFVQLEILTTQKQLKKEIEKFNKTINNKKADKLDKKTAKEAKERIINLFKL